MLELVLPIACPEVIESDDEQFHRRFSEHK
jgi:hypothetical protein